ncbi:hypothetical protein BD309DRAFT_874763 [Dichomitus squalens]|uniref:Uncharacterized protein n=1 Tax=Dichomitus squalens TaxID=114155 RepID=A0A4V2K2W6_9APHY|nr:hypothetical protein BD309DRAFT_874763 [Dichomitus squalens]TBU59652.1 hypothetical protein BD310DRAFT_976517 [Dichomitus squalens]
MAYRVHQGVSGNPFSDAAAIHSDMSSQSHHSGRSTSHDPYFGHRDLAKICSHFIKHLFRCPDVSHVTGSPFDDPAIPLAQFIAHAIHSSKADTSIVFSALYLLQRLKGRYPMSWGGNGMSGQRLFLSALIVASRSSPGPPNRSWVDVGQGLFHHQTVEGIERNLLEFLEYRVDIEPYALKEFERLVRKDFRGQGPYPNYLDTASTSFSTRPQRRNTSVPPPISVHQGVPALSWSPSNTPVTGAPVTPGIHSPSTPVAMTAYGQKMHRPSAVPLPGVPYARASGYLW